MVERDGALVCGCVGWLSLGKLDAGVGLAPVRCERAMRGTTGGGRRRGQGGNPLSRNSTFFRTELLFSISSSFLKIIEI